MSSSPSTAPTRSGCSRCSQVRWTSPDRGTPRPSSGRAGGGGGSGGGRGRGRPSRLMQRLWRVVLDEQTGQPHVSDEAVPEELNRLLHRTIQAVAEGYESL